MHRADNVESVKSDFDESWADTTSAVVSPVSKPDGPLPAQSGRHRGCACLQIRIYRTTLLPSNIVEAILDGRQPRTLQLADLMDDMPVEWDRQRELFEISPVAGTGAAR